MENSLDTRIQHAVIGDTNNAGKTTATDDKPLRGEIVFNNTLTNFRVGINGNTAYSSLPDFLHVFTGANTSHAGTSGLVLAPSQKSSGDPDKFLCDDGSWKAVSSSGGTDTTYKFYLNGTLTYGSDSGGTNLSSPDGTINGIYAPITSGTSGNMLKSNGNNSAPTWDSLENIIGKKTDGYVLAGNGTSTNDGVVSWQSIPTALGLTDANYFLAGPTSGNSATPSFRALNITDIQTPLPDLYAIESLTGTSGVLRKTAANTWDLSASYGDVGLYKKKLQHKLNTSTATDIGDIIREVNSDLSLPPFYAPITGGTSANQLLLSQGSGSPFVASAPAWTTLTFPTTDNTKTLRFVDGSGWTLQDLNYIHVRTVNENFIINTESGNETLYFLNNSWVNASMAYDTLYDYYGINIQPFIKVSSTDPDNYTVTESSSWSANVYNSNLTMYVNEGLRFQKVDVSSGSYQNGFAIALNKATASTIGGMKAAAVRNSSITTTQGGTTSNRYYGVELDNTGKAFVNVPWTGGSGSIPGVASVNGDNPGLLQVTADANPAKVYINTEYATAIPVFYSDGSKENVEIYIYDKGYDGEFPYSLPECYVESEEKVFTGHYVNLEDVINGLIRRPRLLAILKDALDNYKPE